MRGADLDGNEIELIVSVARKLYVCPSCKDTIGIGAEHVLVKRADVTGERYHQHWHTECAVSIAREISIARER